jgi:hypothetical protein
MLAWERALCLLHAALALSIWVLVFTYDKEFLTGKIWMGIVWSWLVWILVALRCNDGEGAAWLATLGLGFLLLIPTMPVAVTFLSWTIFGFAP